MHPKDVFPRVDFIAPLIPFGLGAGIGNFINGELWGRVTDAPWGMVFPHAVVSTASSQLYECLLEGFFVLYPQLCMGEKPPTGVISGLFLFFYGCFRFGVEFVREPDRHLGFIAHGLSMGQLLSLPMIMLGTAFIGYAYYRARLQTKENHIQG